MNRILLDAVEQADTIAIAGHVRPDGDCLGATMAAYNYICENYPEKSVTVMLEDFPDVYKRIKNADKIKCFYEKGRIYDLFLIFDVSDPKRIGIAGEYLGTAKKTLCIDHHISNNGVSGQDYIVPEASSASEVLYSLLEEDKISKSVAECLYIGIICDTGVFKHSNTTFATMTIAGKLMEKGARSDVLIDEVFYSRTFKQTRLLGRILQEAERFCDDQVIYAYVSLKTLQEFSAAKKDLEGVIDQLRVIIGTEVAVLVSQVRTDEYKISLRSSSKADVNSICSLYGGGGHIRAAGCTIIGPYQEVKEGLIKVIGESLS